MAKAVALSNKYKTSMSKCMDKVLHMDYDPVETFINQVRARILTGTSTRVSTYRDFNPSAQAHGMYTTVIPEYKRVVVTRIRMGSHRLKVETGRWSRTPRDQRLCSCGKIQDERHVLLECPISADVRVRLSINANTLCSLMELDPGLLADYVSSVMKLF